MHFPAPAGPHVSVTSVARGGLSSRKKSAGYHPTLPLVMVPLFARSRPPKKRDVITNPYGKDNRTVDSPSHLSTRPRHLLKDAVIGEARLAVRKIRLPGSSAPVHGLVQPSIAPGFWGSAGGSTRRRENPPLTGRDKPDQRCSGVSLFRDWLQRPEATGSKQ